MECGGKRSGTPLWTGSAAEQHQEKRSRTSHDAALNIGLAAVTEALHLIRQSPPLAISDIRVNAHQQEVSPVLLEALPQGARFAPFLEGNSAAMAEVIGEDGAGLLGDVFAFKS